jgi:hypothetical protein
MIQSNSDSLMFQMPDGVAIPCSAETVTIQLIGEAAEALDPELVRNAARAVLHYFKVEQGREFVSVGEFSEALARVLRGFGLEVTESKATDAESRPVGESDLCRIADESGEAFELAFFLRLRDELRHHLHRSPRVIRFKGLRGCVKQLAGARRWSGRCQRLNDQIVDYLRTCWSAERNSQQSALVVR